MKQNVLGKPSTFINPVPHHAFVWGDNVAFLEKRYAAMIKNPLFYGMQMTEDANQIKQWAPLTMEGRDPAQKWQQHVWKLVLM